MEKQQGIGFIPSSYTSPLWVGTNPDPDQLIITYDSGYGSSFDDAQHHMLVLGTTGSGKTASVVLPVLLNLMRGGHCGVAGAVKGHMAQQIRALARQCGREEDIIEIGSYPSATKFNLLARLELFEIKLFLEALIRDSYHGSSNNEDFQAKGIALVGDCAELLCYLGAIDPAFEPNVAILAEMINDYVAATQLYVYFKERVYDSSNRQQARFVARVESDAHHIFKEELDPEKRKKQDRDNRERNTQLAYNLSNARPALKNFLDAPGIASNFATPGAPPLDIEALIQSGKILVPNFGPETGQIGAGLLRAIMQRYYKTILRKGLQLTKNNKIFFVLDEYQEIADLDNKALSDTSMIALARELNCMFILSTQSLASLTYRCNHLNSRAGIESLLSNINTRYVFFTDDDLTQDMAYRYDKNMVLNQLEAGQAFVIRFDKASRKHVYGLESFNNAYASTSDISNLEIDLTLPDMPEIDGSHDLMDLVARTLELEKGAREKTINSAIRNTLEINENENVIQGSRHNQIRLDKSEIILKTFPQFFPAEASSARYQLPGGWVNLVIRALAAIQSSGITLEITSFTASSGQLQVTGDNFRSRDNGIGLKMLNYFLKPTRYTCVLCGSICQDEQLSTLNNVEKNRASYHMPVCQNCLEKFGMSRDWKNPGAKK